MADQLWSTELKENTMVSSMVFGFFVLFCFLCFIYSRLEAEEVGNQETSRRQKKKTCEACPL